MGWNLLANGRMEIDDLNEGAEVACENALGSATPVASRWYVQFLAEGAEAHARRVLWPGSRGAVGACRITITNPATRVVDLDRMQLFQPVMWDELFGTALGSDFIGRAVSEGSLPLTMAFSIKTNVDIEVGCTINNTVPDRNWTTNRRVRAGTWQRIEFRSAAMPARHSRPTAKASASISRLASPAGRPASAL
jgi:hypothetical protein